MPRRDTAPSATEVHAPDGGFLRLPAGATQILVPLHEPALAPLAAIGLLRGGLIITPAGLEIRRPGRDDHLLVLALRAGVPVVLNDQRFTLAAGHACWVAPGQDLALRHRGGGTAWVLRLAFAVGSAVGRVAGTGPIGALPRGTLLAEALRGLLTLHRDADGHGDPAELADYAGIVRRHLDRALFADADDAALRRVWEEVAAAPALPWDSAALARVAGLHPRAFARRLRDRDNCSPRDLVVHVRMRSAETLLSGSDQGLDGIAAQVGYADAFAFSKAFTRHHGGTSPSAWRGGKVSRG